MRSQHSRARRLSAVAVLPLLLVAGGCHSAPPLETVELSPEVRTEAGERWMSADQRRAVEAFAAAGRASIESKAHVEALRMEAGRQRVRAIAAEMRAAGGAALSVQAALGRQMQEYGHGGWAAEKAREKAQHYIDVYARCTEPTIDANDPDPFVEPGQDVILYGCKFGAEPGSVRLTLKHSKSSFDLAVLSWQDDFVVATLPEISGEMDQPAELRLTDAGHHKSDAYPIDFRASREVQLLMGARYGLSVHAAGGDHSAGTPLECANPDPVTHVGTERVLYTMAVTHYHNCCWPPISGADTFTVDLENGWVFDDISTLVFGISHGALLQEDGRVDSISGFMKGDPHLELKVNWWMDHIESGVSYITSISIRGPKGVPYSHNPWPPHLPLPGAPCTP